MNMVGFGRARAKPLTEDFDLSDEDLTALADELFLGLDREEEEDKAGSDS